MDERVSKLIVVTLTQIDDDVGKAGNRSFFDTLIDVGLLQAFVRTFVDLIDERFEIILNGDRGFRSDDFHQFLKDE